MEEAQTFDQALFDKLLIRKDGLAALLQSDTVRLLKSIEHDFPNITKVKNLG